MTVIGGGGVGVVEVFTQRVLQIKYDLYVSLELWRTGEQVYLECTCMYIYIYVLIAR